MTAPDTRLETAVLTIRGPREQVEIINDLLNPDSYTGVTSTLRPETRAERGCPIADLRERIAEWLHAWARRNGTGGLYDWHELMDENKEPYRVKADEILALLGGSEPVAWACGGDFTRDAEKADLWRREASTPVQDLYAQPTQPDALEALKADIETLGRMHHQIENGDLRYRLLKKTEEMRVRVLHMRNAIAALTTNEEGDDV